MRGELSSVGDKVDLLQTLGPRLLALLPDRRLGVPSLLCLGVEQLLGPPAAVVAGLEGVPGDDLSDSDRCDCCDEPDNSEDARECEFARFLYVPPVATNVTMTAVGLLPVLDGTTTVALRQCTF